MDLLEGDIRDEIQDAAFEVRRHLDFGYKEEIYKKALLLELQSRGIKAVREYPIKVYYKGQEIGDFYADFFVNDNVIVEVKATTCLVKAHEIQLINYLTATGIDYGLLINFGGERFEARKKERIYTRF